MLPLNKERKQKHIYKFSVEARRNVSRAQKKRVESGSYVNGFYGKHHSKEWGEKISKMQLGRKHTEESKRKMSLAMKGKKRSKETKRRISKAMTKQWQNLEYAEKQLKAIYATMKTKPNKPERKLRNGLNRMFPGEYKYVGDGKVWFGKRCPDFINVNGQKKIIEMFGDFWHSEEVNGRTRKQEENQRIGYFAGYGFKTLIIWEREFQNIRRLKKKLIEFHKV